MSSVEIQTPQGPFTLEFSTVSPQVIRQRVQDILARSNYRPAPRELVPLIDLTSLGDSDQPDQVDALCARAVEQGVAAVCVWPQFADYCKQRYPKLKVAVVGTHFPRTGAAPISWAETTAALAIPVDEVDMVVDPHLVAQRAWSALYEEVHSLAQRCHQRRVRLKVILESGMEERWQLIAPLTRLCVAAGADFIKTSTGKVPVGATLEASYLILRGIQQGSPGGGRPAVGFKPSGGMRTYEEALPFVQLTHFVLGPQALCPEGFRLGASSLLQALLKEGGHGL